MSNNNPVLDTDSYIASQSVQYPPGTTSMFQYLECRGSKRYDRSVFFGLQYLLKKYLTQRITMDMVEEARDFFVPHGEPFPIDGWTRVATELGGRLPIRIRAVPEGTVVPLSNALVTAESTDPETFWVTGWFETMLVRLWYPMLVATRSHNIKHNSIIPLLEQTSDLDANEACLFMLHDFGSRGSTSRESAAIGGASHLVNFRGSDTVVGIDMANRYYNEDMAAFSIPAMMHATVTSWGLEGEERSFRNMLAEYGKPGALVAFVSDSYDIRHAVDVIWGQNMREDVIKSGATIVIRPDSGDPETEVLYCLNSLAQSFGFDVNSKGYKVLRYVRIIQGDGMNEESIDKVLRSVAREGFSVENTAYGMGGGLLQEGNRDTLEVAHKCSSVIVDGQERDVFKQPKTDPGKNSKRGRLDLVPPGGMLPYSDDASYTTQQLRWGTESYAVSAMRIVFLNGYLLVDDTLENIRRRADNA